jgi:site-specific DNA-methyltransferase (adenine-specific)
MSIEHLLGKIHNCDCLEFMKQLPDKCVDLVLTDPPYGIKISRKSNNFGSSTSTSRKKTDLGWDDCIPTKEFFDEMFRISKNQIVFGANYFWENFYSSPCYIVWDKRGGLPEVPFADTEFAWTSFKKMSKKYTFINHGFIKDTNDEKNEHPTSKPSELFMAIGRDFMGDTDVVFDPFMGSGTTAVACERLGRKWFGCELEPKYCEIANKRIEAERNQLKLF